MINLEILILLGGYNQFIKGYQITTKFMISLSDGVPTQIKVLFGGTPTKRVGEPLV